MSASALIHVTGLGMVSSLGLDVATSCAAARAGLSRARPWDRYPAMSVEGEDVGLVCHMVPLITDGFEGAVRMKRLMTLALQDLLTRAPWLPSAGKSACYLSLPTACANTPQGEPGVVATGGQWWRDAAALAGWPAPPPVRFATAVGHTGVARALAQAAADLQSGAIDVAVLGGVDSLLDVLTLSRLESTGRLKTPNAPAGLQAGEGAAFVLLERDERMRARGGQAWAVLRGLGFGQEPHAFGADCPPTGRGLAEALHSVLKRIHFKHLLPVWCISDHTGESMRAMDWGSAQVHLEAQQAMRLIGETIYPAASFGDTGAASGALALCQAACAFERRYAPGSVAALLSSGEAGDRAALLCQAA